MVPFVYSHHSRVKSYTVLISIWLIADKRKNLPSAQSQRLNPPNKRCVLCIMKYWRHGWMQDKSTCDGSKKETATSWVRCIHRLSKINVRLHTGHIVTAFIALLKWQKNNKLFPNQPDVGHLHRTKSNRKLDSIKPTRVSSRPDEGLLPARWDAPQPASRARSDNLSPIFVSAVDQMIVEIWIWLVCIHRDCIYVDS